MFTGIIAAVGVVASVMPSSGGLRLRVGAGALDLGDVAIGDSIAVNGVCLTVAALGGGEFEVDVSHETLACTAGFLAGERVNLEKALRLADRLGGHLVSGHVDGVGTIVRVEDVGDNRRIVVGIPPQLERYFVRKASVALNGVSLTVNEARREAFSVNLIPHTLAATSLAGLEARSRVNLEVDLIARYVEGLAGMAPGGGARSGANPARG
jgi:riboflavin synthase